MPLYMVTFGYGKFSCISEGLSFLDGGNVPFFGLLSLIVNLIVKLKQVNVGSGSCIFGALHS